MDYLILNQTYLSKISTDYLFNSERDIINMDFNKYITKNIAYTNFSGNCTI